MTLKQDIERIEALKLGKKRTAILCNILADVERRKIYDELKLPFSAVMKWVPKEQPPIQEPPRDTAEREENEPL